MSHRLSGSKVHLAMVCGYAFRKDVAYEPRPSGTAAHLGTAVHGLVEAHLKGTEVSFGVFDADAKPMAAQATYWLDRQEPPTAVEIAIVYDAATDTARRIEGAGHRNYGELGPLEIPTTLDLVWVTDGAVIVRDLKSGQKQHAHVEQLVVQALAASRLYGKRRAEVGFVWARKTKCDVDELIALDESRLDAEAWTLAGVLAALPSAQPNPGRHCFSCPMTMKDCPAHQEPNEEERQAASL